MENNNQDIELIDEGGAGDDTKLKKLRDDLKRCEEEKKNYLDGWQRAKADYINYKNDEAKRLEDVGRFITSGLISDILPVLDSFDLALGHEMPTEIQKGILLIQSQLKEVLKKRGVTPIAVKEGNAFDPEKHESVGEIESKAPPGTIAEEVQKGYMLRENVLRPTRVRIAK